MSFVLTCISNYCRITIVGNIHTNSLKETWLSCFHAVSLPGQHWCWEWRRAHPPPCPSALVPRFPADRRFWWLAVWPGLSRCLSSTSSSVFIWVSWRLAPAPRVGDGQDRLWAEILPQVSMLASSALCSLWKSQNAWNLKVCYGNIQLFKIRVTNQPFLEYSHSHGCREFCCLILSAD